jgi:acyl-CoA dehydrogenase
MAVIREHLAAKGLGLHNDLQTEHSIVGNNPFIIMFKEFATNSSTTLRRHAAEGQIRTGFGLTEPNHGSDATFMETRAVREDPKDGVAGWRINGEKMWTTGMHVANYIMTFARTSGEGRRRAGHHRASWCRPAIPA